MIDLCCLTPLPHSINPYRTRSGTGDPHLHPNLRPQANLVPDFLTRFFIRLSLAASLKSIDTGRVDLNTQNKLAYVKGDARSCFSSLVIGHCDVSVMQILKLDLSPSSRRTQTSNTMRVSAQARLRLIARQLY